MACLCGKPWMSILPPPPCPYHTGLIVSIDPAPRCRGRHCKHNDECFPMIYATTWNSADLAPAFKVEPKFERFAPRGE